MDIISVFALAFQYPGSGHSDVLVSETQSFNNEPGSKELSIFASTLEGLSLSEQEELYTRTLDLSPLTAPYVGYHIWGENYQRGEFMAALNKEMRAYEIDLEGELPDHLLPILRYLQKAPSPLPALTEILGQSLTSMIKSLKKVEKDNPYLFLFEALQKSFGAVKVEG